eukprot:scaffold105_cov359-Prasinococcus_capsulatus_cf.AAC.5
MPRAIATMQFRSRALVCVQLRVAAPLPSVATAGLRTLPPLPGARTVPHGRRSGTARRRVVRGAERRLLGVAGNTGSRTLVLHAAGAPDVEACHQPVELLLRGVQLSSSLQHLLLGVPNGACSALFAQADGQ